MNYVSGFQVYMGSLAVGFLVVLGIGMRVWLDAETHIPQDVLVRLYDFSSL